MLKKAAESLDWMAQNYGVLLVVEANDLDLKAFLDENLIHRILINLLSNAIKHSPRGSTVNLVANRTLEGELRIAVKDQGEGLSEEDQLYIFDKYRQATRRREGGSIDSGLGLTFCKLAVEAQRGRIELESTLGKGSTFILVFPTLC
jgi:signal transduction histidine kinase